MIKDHVLGTVLTAIFTCSFVYYTIWLLILPFIDERSSIHGLFPDPYYAIAGPTVILVVCVTGVFAFVGHTLSTPGP